MLSYGQMHLPTKMMHVRTFVLPSMLIAMDTYIWDMIMSFLYPCDAHRVERVCRRARLAAEQRGTVSSRIFFHTLRHGAFFRPLFFYRCTLDASFSANSSSMMKTSSITNKDTTIPATLQSFDEKENTVHYARHESNDDQDMLSNLRMDDARPNDGVISIKKEEDDDGAQDRLLILPPSSAFQHYCYRMWTERAMRLYEDCDRSMVHVYYDNRLLRVLRIWYYSKTNNHKYRPPNAQKKTRFKSECDHMDALLAICAPMFHVSRSFYKELRFYDSVLGKRVCSKTKRHDRIIQLRIMARKITDRKEDTEMKTIYDHLLQPPEKNKQDMLPSWFCTWPHYELAFYLRGTCHTRTHVTINDAYITCVLRIFENEPYMLGIALPLHLDHVVYTYRLYLAPRQDIYKAMRYYPRKVSRKIMNELADGHSHPWLRDFNRAIGVLRDGMLAIDGLDYLVHSMKHDWCHVLSCAQWCDLLDVLYEQISMMQASDLTLSPSLTLDSSPSSNAVQDQPQDNNNPATRVRWSIDVMRIYEEWLRRHCAKDDASSQQQDCAVKETTASLSPSHHDMSMQHDNETTTKESPQDNIHHEDDQDRVQWETDVWRFYRQMHLYFAQYAKRYHDDANVALRYARLEYLHAHLYHFDTCVMRQDEVRQHYLVAARYVPLWLLDCNMMDSTKTDDSKQ